MRNTRRIVALALALALALSLAGCGQESAPATSASPSPSPSPSPAPTADQGKAVTVCVGREPDTLDPVLNATAAGTVIIQHLFEGLMRWEDNGQSLTQGVDGAQLACGQAQSYDRVENADGTVTYTFHLRPGLKWSDGKPLTAQDFAYTWRRVVEYSSQVSYSDLLSCVVNAPEIMAGTEAGENLAVSAPDEETFSVTVHDVPWFLQLCAHPVTYPLRADVGEETEGQWAYDPEKYVCNGRYVLEHWDYGTHIVLARNSAYYAPFDGPDTITFVPSEDGQGAVQAVQAGQLDLSAVVDAGAAPALLDKGEMAALPYTGTYFLTFQTAQPPFDDPRVRQAFALAVDRAGLVAEVTQGGQTPAGALVPPGVSQGVGKKDFRAVGGDYLDPSAAAYEANCQKAKELLAQAGYPGGAGFPEATYLCSNSGEHPAIGQALVEMWREVLGVSVTLDSRDWSAFLQARREGAFSIARDSWVADWDDPLTFLDRWTAQGANNTARYADADYDQLLESAQTAADATARQALLHRAEDLLVGEAWALCPVYFYTKPCLKTDGLTGVYYSPLGYWFFDAATKR